MRTDFLHKTADGAAMAEVELAVDGAMPFKIAATDAAYLENTYSRSFVSEMAIQLTARIESQMMISGLAKSDIALQLVFAPGTYMEHPQGEFTYRRLLISENGRAVKDFWICWQRVGEGKNFTVCDEVSADEIRFSIGEDVPQKVREKEYRFLVQADADKYRAAMGRKNVTEWREIIKRAVKRGTLAKITIDEKVAEHAGQIKDKLEEILGKMQPAPQATEIPVSQETDEAYEKAMAYMRSFVQENTVATEEPTEEEADELATVEEAEEIEEVEETEETEEVDEEPVQESFSFDAPVCAEPKAEPTVDVDALRAEMERQLRAELHEREKALLQREYELERKRKALDDEIKEHELNRAEREIELRRQAQNEARLDWEAKERDRLTAQALEAIELRKAEEARIAEEARKAEEARIAEEARKAEEARIAEEARKAEEARIAEEARKAEEARIAEEARKAEEARIAETGSATDTVYTYTQKMVHLIFRHPVDPNVMTRIQELMADTIRYFGKEHVFIKVKASIPAEDTVDLHFTQFPVEEHKLLVDMIQVLGNSDLGICRVLVD